MDENELTIDELATLALVSTRTIRSYRARGLLPEPRRRGRTPYYDRRHVTRLVLITALQRQGLSLDAVRALLDPDAVVRSTLVPVARLRALLRAQPKLAQALKAGGLVDHHRDELLVRAPRAVFAAMGLRRSGVPEAKGLAVLAELSTRDLDRAASVLADIRTALGPELPPEELVALATEAFRTSLSVAADLDE